MALAMMHLACQMREVFSLLAWVIGASQRSLVGPCVPVSFAHRPLTWLLVLLYSGAFHMQPPSLKLPALFSYNTKPAWPSVGFEHGCISPAWWERRRSLAWEAPALLPSLPTQPPLHLAGNLESTFLISSPSPASRPSLSFIVVMSK